MLPTYIYTGNCVVSRSATNKKENLDKQTQLSLKPKVNVKGKWKSY